MDKSNIIDLVIERKKFKSYKVISRGQYSASVNVDYENKEKSKSILIITKKEIEKRKIDLQELQNQFTVKVLHQEYLCKLQTYIIYTDSGECTLKEKLEDKVFKKSPQAIESIVSWLRDAAHGFKKLHSKGYVHLNINSTTLMITSTGKLKIGGIDKARSCSTQEKR